MYFKQIASGAVVALSILSGASYGHNVLSPTKYTYADHYQSQVLYKQNKGNLAGNPNGKITVVDFSDYQCMPCRIMNKTATALTRKYHNLRVVYIDYPMLGPKSTFAAKAALAAIQQKKYLPFHNALMQSKRPLTKQQVFALASHVGIKVKALKAEIGSKTNVQALLNNMMLGTAFGVTGMPTFIVGNTVSPHNTRVYPGLNTDQLDSLIGKIEKDKAHG